MHPISSFCTRPVFQLERDELYRLDYSSPMENAVIEALLRAYGGLFVDFCFIDETFVAREANLSREQVYTTLVGLSRKHIVKFIPRKNTPIITYLRDRLDGEDLCISPEVYEEREADFAKRIQAMIAYCENDDECRSRQLLRYFGETASKDCQHCDVCLSRSRQQPEADLKEQILQLLADHKGHSISEIKAQFGQTEAGKILTLLMAEEQVTTDGSSIWLNE